MQGKEWHYGPRDVIEFSKVPSLSHISYFLNNYSFEYVCIVESGSIVF